MSGQIDCGSSSTLLDGSGAVVTKKWDESFMHEAFTFAEEAYSCAEVPVGCVFVTDLAPFSDGRSPVVIAGGRNEVNQTKNATRHAELVAIDRILARCQQLQVDPATLFPSTTLYVTVEPCIMCAAALHQLNIALTVFACGNERFGGMGSVMDVGLEMYSSAARHVRATQFEGQAVELLKRFYKQENMAAPEDMRKNKADR